MPPMSTISIHRSKFHSFFFNGCTNGHKCPRIAASCATTMKDSKFFPKMKNIKEELSISIPPVDKVETPRSGDLRFDRLQPSDHELVGDNIFEFGQFVARQAMLDEEYWAAAWLRAENHWENPTYEGHEIRFIHNYKLKYADQEFHALKKRCRGQNNQGSTCIIAVKKEQKNVKRPILKSVVGTLDLNIQYLLQGESFPGERGKAPPFCSINRTALGRYAYIANLCVAKSARRQGIASNMLRFAVESAKSNGVKQVYMHVDRNNKTAQMLYQKIGFEVKHNTTFSTFCVLSEYSFSVMPLLPPFQMVEMANSQLLQKQMFLLCLQT